VVDSGSNWPTEYDCERYVFGVGCSGIAKGICELVPCSRGVGEVCEFGFSLPKKLWPAGTVEVGDGKTSVSREGGSFRSDVHIPVPQGNDGWCPRTIAPEDEGCAAHTPLPVSADGVLGWDVVGDIELPANDPFLG
jgi:hypothetical protein